ncbi:hypothetical protein R3P38DRAFT_1108722 [Favolaschia claudopus]|uniref:F-box domain-containing protein n=1 Tax=Favolaschia claudopus TaxID=2862362 RepID=A0AAW0B788_9AGAR
MSLQESPFAARLNTNYVPSDAEVLEIRSLLAGPEDDLASLDAEIEAMENALMQLKEKREALKKPIDAHRALISPMRLLPIDILTEIFLTCLPSKHEALIDESEAPLLLGRGICRHWRAVAYSTPALWSSINIPWQSGCPPAILAKLETVVEAWLKRSAACSLSVALALLADHNAEEISTDRSLVSQLLSVSGRLRHLGVIGDSQSMLPFLQLRPQNLPLLRSIVLTCHDGRILDGEAENPLQASTLEQISLYAQGVAPLSLPINWKQLTRLRLECEECFTPGVGLEGGLALDDALDLLRRASNLVFCHLQIFHDPAYGGARTFSSSTPIVLPHIRTLTLTRIVFEEWISHLVTPNLRYLQIGATAVNAKDPRLLLVLETNSFTGNAFEELLRCFPSISHLHIFGDDFHTVGVDNSYIKLFQAPHNLCPLMTDLEIDMAALSGEDVLKLVQGRMATTTPLERLKVRFARDKKVDVMPELQAFIADGLRVEFYPHWQKQWEFDPFHGVQPYLWEPMYYT